jgi:hypothetical protein
MYIKMENKEERENNTELLILNKFLNGAKITKTEPLNYYKKTRITNIIPKSLI